MYETGILMGQEKMGGILRCQRLYFWNHSSDITLTNRKHWVGAEAWLSDKRSARPYILWWEGCVSFIFLIVIVSIYLLLCSRQCMECFLLNYGYGNWGTPMASGQAGMKTQDLTPELTACFCSKAFGWAQKHTRPSIGILWWSAQSLNMEMLKSVFSPGDSHCSFHKAFILGRKDSPSSSWRAKFFQARGNPDSLKPCVTRQYRKSLSQISWNWVWPVGSKP